MKKFFALLLALVMTMSLAVPALAADDEKPFDNSSFFEVGDYRLHYREFTPSGAPKGQILLIHGFCLSTASLEGVAEEYRKEGYRVVLADVPNFGYSSRETSQTDFLSREEVIGALMSELGGKWIVGGHSMGGGIAINLACEMPETVKGLVLYAPQTSNEMTGVSAVLMRSAFMQKLFNFIVKLFLIMPSFVRSFVATSFSDSEYAKTYDLDKVTKPFRISGTGAGITIMTSHTRGTNFEAFSALKIPCVIITAAEDKVAMADNLQAIIDNAPEGTVVECVEKGGHMMMEYNPSLTAELTLPTIALCK